MVVNFLMMIDGTDSFLRWQISVLMSYNLTRPTISRDNLLADTQIHSVPLATDYLST